MLCRSAPSLRLIGVVVLASSFGCSDPPAGPLCRSSGECAADQVCVSGACAPEADAGPAAGACPEEDVCGGGRICCEAGEECVDGFTCAPRCETTRCGDNGLTCCDAGEVCLDGVVCAAACEAGQALCGEDLDACCDAGDVCVEDACVSPGAMCENDFDCLREGTYCEPTVGRCLDNPAPPLCEVRPDFEEVALQIEWHWNGAEVDGERYANVVAPPIVGDITGDGIPEVVVPVYRGNSLDAGILVAIDGRRGETLWVSREPNAPDSQGTVALADLEPSDPALEIVYVTEGHRLVVLDGDGTTEIASRDAIGSAERYHPSVHDLEGDGIPDIVVGARAFSLVPEGDAFVLQERFSVGDCSFSGAHSVVANLDEDAALEVTCGGSAYDADGELLWRTGDGEAGYAAVADLDLDGTPEVVRVRSGQVTIRRGGDGAMLVGDEGAWLSQPLAIPGGGTGGPPTIADFDADGLPEISAAGRGAYVVYDLDCLGASIPGREGGDCDRPESEDDATGVRWTAPVQDFSSSRTGSSLFDFQGDGVAEVIYNDECFLHVFDGRRGDELLMEPFANSSRTGSEYPVVVDVDRDGNSEIVVPANNDELARDGCRATWRAAFGAASNEELPDRFRNGTQGIYALGDPGDRWVRTRPIWNQYAYAVTHIGDRGEVPLSSLANWETEGLNNFRQNVQGEGVFNAPNLTVELDAVASCGRGEVRLSAVVRNVGSRGVPAGVAVEIVEVAPEARSLAALATREALLPGGSERLTMTLEDVPFDVDLVFRADVDGASAVAECNTEDNGAEAQERCAGLR